MQGRRTVIRNGKPIDPLFGGVDGLLRRAQMTLKDLATWLDRPMMTLRSWVEGGAFPSSDKRGDIKARMALLRAEVLRAEMENRTVAPNRRGRSAEARAAEIRALYEQARGRDHARRRDEAEETIHT